jgi:hypothetical protein
MSTTRVSAHRVGGWEAPSRIKVDLGNRLANTVVDSFVNVGLVGESRHKAWSPQFAIDLSLSLGVGMGLQRFSILTCSVPVDIPVLRSVRLLLIFTCSI